MPRHCVVPGCKSNYASTSEAISTFSFPKDHQIKQKWINAIHRANWQPTNSSSVCAIHFREPDFQLSGKYKKARLVYDAVPSVFPNLPQYLTKTETKIRKDPEIRREVINTAVENDNEQFLRSDIIENFDDLKAKFREKLNFENFLVHNSNDKLVFFLLQSDDDLDCKIVVRISVNKDLIVRIILEESEVPYVELK